MSCEQGVFTKLNIIYDEVLLGVWIYLLSSFESVYLFFLYYILLCFTMCFFYIENIKTNNSYISLLWSNISVAYSSAFALWDEENDCFQKSSTVFTWISFLKNVCLAMVKTLCCQCSMKNFPIFNVHVHFHHCQIYQDILWTHQQT